MRERTGSHASDLGQEQQLIEKLRPYSLDRDQSYSVNYFLSSPDLLRLTLDLSGDTDDNGITRRCLVITKEDAGFKVEERKLQQLEDRKIGDDTQLEASLMELVASTEQRYGLSLGAFHARTANEAWNVTVKQTGVDGSERRLVFSGTPDGKTYGVKVFGEPKTE